MLRERGTESSRCWRGKATQIFRFCESISVSSPSDGGILYGPDLLGSRNLKRWRNKREFSDWKMKNRDAKCRDIKSHCIKVVTLDAMMYEEVTRNVMTWDLVTSRHNLHLYLNGTWTHVRHGLSVETRAVTWHGGIVVSLLISAVEHFNGPVS